MLVSVTFSDKRVIIRFEIRTTSAKARRNEYSEKSLNAIQNSLLIFSAALG